MGTISVRSGSHPVIPKALASGSVQATVIMVGLFWLGLPFHLTRIITLIAFADYFGSDPSF